MGPVLASVVFAWSEVNGQHSMAYTFIPYRDDEGGGERVWRGEGSCMKNAAAEGQIRLVLWGNVCHS